MLLLVLLVLLSVLPLLPTLFLVHLVLLLSNLAQVVGTAGLTYEPAHAERAPAVRIIDERKQSAPERRVSAAELVTVGGTPRLVEEEIVGGDVLVDGH